MRIVCIFEQELYAVHYDNQADNEYNRLMNLWTDVGYLYEYAKNHHIPNPDVWAEQRAEDADEFDERLDELTLKTDPLDTFFRPFHDNEYGREMRLSQRKGKIDRNKLRFYAVKVYDNCYVITGGCIKRSQATQENEENDKEIDKMKHVRDYLLSHDIVDDLSFYEFLNEQE
ncbi:MAG: hypothetical protein NXI10_01295 [bacterium]|nr:hypothetical protein [bacterium]